MLLSLAVLSGLTGLQPALAAEHGWIRPECHAVTPVQDRIDTPSPQFRCGGRPAAYNDASLWFRLDVPREHAVLGSTQDRLKLLVKKTQFDRLVVIFRYADGAERREYVENGNFGGHWRAGGQIAFVAPDRDFPLIAIDMRVDRLVSIEYLRMRLLTEAEGVRLTTSLGGVIGAALMLLALGALYNVSLAFVTRQQASLWQGAWGLCMVAWGLFWSQFILMVLPGVAGAPSVRIASALSCVAVALATFGTVTAIDRRFLPKYLRPVAMLVGSAVVLVGQALAWLENAVVVELETLQSCLILADLLLVAVALAIAWRRGSSDARSFAGAWCVPMLALATIELADIDDLFWGAGAPIFILCASAWQTAWLSVAISRSHGRLRKERDLARYAEAQAHELARRDPLTGLRNRRGFIELARPMLQKAADGEGPVSLLLIDVDRFKQVNDLFGHEAGDEVLCAIARRIGGWESPLCAVARLGGEEFALLVGGLDGFGLARFAESVRAAIAACDHTDAVGDMRVTVSIGTAAVADKQGSSFRDLYRRADEALYKAKRSGRNKVRAAASPATSEGALILATGC